MNNLFQNALKRIPQRVPPVWFMRQAGRYHQHYQKLRAQYSFIDMCRNAELAAEVTLGPIQDFDFDVAILFSDLLFPLDAMGMGLSYEPAPKLEWQLTEGTIGRLRPLHDALPGLAFQKDAMVATRKKLADDKSLIGFVGGPWTLFAYAVEGGHKGGLELAKKELRLFPPFCHLLIPLLKENIRLQLEGGAEIVMLFDTAAGELSPGIYRDLVVEGLKDLAETFPGKLGYYAKGVTAAHFKHEFFASGTLAGLGFDHRWDLPAILDRYNRGFVQGCFDQSLLFQAPEDFQKSVANYLAPIRRLPVEKRCGWVSGLGHGVLPGTPEDNVRTLVKMIREVMA